MKIRRLKVADAPELQRIIKSPLDQESTYCYALHASHHGHDSVVLEKDGKIVGVVMGKVTALTGHEPELFIWKVIVDPDLRGKGLGVRMIEELYKVRSCGSISATVTKDNRSSIRMFKKIFDNLNLEIFRSNEPYFTSEDLGGAPAEYRIIGVRK